MNTKVPGLLWRSGYFMLATAAFVLLLFLMNLRSRLYYHGPNYGFLFWIFVYLGIVGIGLLRLKKWAVIGEFVPAILYLALFLYDFRELAHGFPASWVFLNVAIFAFFLGIPLFTLRHWNELQWGL